MSTLKKQQRTRLIYVSLLTLPYSLVKRKAGCQKRNIPKFSSDTLNKAEDLHQRFVQKKRYLDNVVHANENINENIFTLGRTAEWNGRLLRDSTITRIHKQTALALKVESSQPFVIRTFR